jgi:uncharacterized membrane protein
VSLRSIHIFSLEIILIYRDAAYLQKTEKRQYIIYSCYAWGCTALFLIIALITNFVEGSHLKPGFGDGNCWFSGRTETWLFFYGPIAFLVAANLILFVLSSYHLSQQTQKYEVNNLNNLKHRYNQTIMFISLIIRLFLGLLIIIFYFF